MKKYIALIFALCLSSSTFAYSDPPNNGQNIKRKTVSSGVVQKSPTSGTIGSSASATVLVPHWKDGVSVGNLTNAADWQEISGITNPTVPANSAYMWVQSDGSIDKLLAVSLTNASSQGEWTLTGINGVDYEDLASARIGGQSYIYLADFGDNGNARATFIIYRIKEPTITGNNGTIDAGDIETITCEYPAGSLPSHKDAECLLVDPDTGDMYVITKREAVPGVYKLAHAGSYAGTNTLEDLGNMYDIPDIASTAATGNVVGGNISPNGKEILIKSYGDIYYFSRNKATQTIMQALQQTGTLVPAYVGGGTTSYQHRHPYFEPQGEAVSYNYSGTDFYTASEYVSGEGSGASAYPLFKYERLTKVPTEISFQDGVSPTAGYAGTLDTYVWDTNPTTAYGTETTFISDTAVGVESDQRYGIVKFDISTIPSGATVVGARLDLFVSTEGQGWNLYKMTADWNESSTYNTVTAGVISTTIAGTVEHAYGTYMNTLVVSTRHNPLLATVQGWVTSSATNFGWFPKATDIAGGDGQQWSARNNATTANRPKLTIRYTV